MRYVANQKKGIQFLGMVSAMDEAVGRVVDSLKMNGYWENTLLIFTTDVSKCILSRIQLY